MASLEHLDLLIGEALECIVEASGEVKEITMPDQKETLIELGKIIWMLWNIRDSIYNFKPGLKRDFVLEQEKNEQRYETLNDICNRAYEAEQDGTIDYAMSLYRELLGKSRFGYFRLLGEAGLYRLSKSINSDQQEKIK